MGVYQRVRLVANFLKHPLDPTTRCARGRRGEDTLDEANATAYLLVRAAQDPARIARRRAAARPFQNMVRRPRLVAARASARVAGEGPRKPLRAADRTDRRRQDAGGIFADAGGIVCFWFNIAAAPFPPPPAASAEAAWRRRAQRWGGVGGGGCLRAYDCQRICGCSPHPRPRERASLASDPTTRCARGGRGEARARRVAVASRPHLFRPRRAAIARPAHALHLAAQSARRRHRAQSGDADRRDGAADKSRDPHRRYAGVAAAAAAALSAGYFAHHPRAAGAAAVVRRRAVPVFARSGASCSTNCMRW